MKIRCRACGDEIESKHVHDMVWCECMQIAIDGGKEYSKITAWPDTYDVVVDNIGDDE